MRIFEKLDLILQGGYSDFTNDIISAYSEVPFVNKIILSTWKDDDLSSLNERENLIIIQSEKPKSLGDDNINLQIVSSFEGIQLATTEYSIKMRTDQLYDYHSMIRMYDFFIEHRNEENIFVAGMYPGLLFHPRDHIFWSKTKNLYRLFNIPLKSNNITEKVKIDKWDLWKFYPFYVRSETYIGAHYCSEYDDKVKVFLLQPEKYLHDYAPNWNEAFDLSHSLSKRVFKSFPSIGINLSWPKKDLSQYPYEEQRIGYHERWHEDGV
jgi:hypothetical protein